MSDITDKVFWTGEYRLKDLGNIVLSSEITQLFEIAGYDGKYTWYGAWNNDMRPVITIFLLKGNCGILEWGWNFNFLPEEHSGKLQYFRTDKNPKPQLRTFPARFAEMKEWHQYSLPCNSSDKNKLIKVINKVWKKTVPEIKAWYQRVNTYEKMIEELDRQVECGKYYEILLPEQQYIKAFLLSKLGRKEEAIETIKESYFWEKADNLLRHKVLMKLR